MYDSGSRFVIERIEPPSFMGDPFGQDLGENFHHLTGEQGQWGYAIPLVYQLLNAPTRSGMFFRRPLPYEHAIGLAYWAALLHLLIYSFGWRNPGIGLLRWYQKGKPLDDVRFRLVNDLWSADGRLDEMAYWLLTEAPSQVVWPLVRLIGNKPLPTDHQVFDPDWLAQWLPIAGSISPEQVTMGSMHMTGHCMGPIERVRTTPRLLKSTTTEHRAVLILDSMRGWYRQLFEVKLPPLGDRSWYVDVIAKPVGYLGTFRRSRVTGLYFSGRHRYHVLGEP